MTVELGRLLQKLNIRISSGGMYVPMSEAGNEKVKQFELALSEGRFLRSKTPNTDSYCYTYKKGESEVDISYRYGKGYMAILRIATPV